MLGRGWWGWWRQSAPWNLAHVKFVRAAFRSTQGTLVDVVTIGLVRGDTAIGRVEGNKGGLRIPYDVHVSRTSLVSKYK